MPDFAPNRTPKVLATLCVTAWIAIGSSGCQVITNPVANGIPVRVLPPELLAESKESLEMIPLEWLKQPSPEVYRLAPGDILGVYIDGVLGSRNELPPVTSAEGDFPPAVGLPIPVREDGTLPLPLVAPVAVEGLTVGEAERKIVEVYTQSQGLLQDEKTRILVSLMRRRATRVQVIRQDSGLAGGSLPLSRGPLSRSGPAPSLSGSPQDGNAAVVELPAYENDLLNALTRTGGLPGPDAMNEVVIRRASPRPGTNSERMETPWNVKPEFSEQDLDGRADEAETGHVVRIPLRRHPGEPRGFRPSDILLHPGDIVFVQRRPAEYYYTAGLLANRKTALPGDADLRVVEAVVEAGGPFINGQFSANNLSGQINNTGLGTPNPSLLSVLRRMPDGRQVVIRVDLNRAARDPRENILVQAGDILVLQETTDETLARYTTGILQFSFFGRWLDRRDATGTATVIAP